MNTSRRGLLKLGGVTIAGTAVAGTAAGCTDDHHSATTSTASSAGTGAVPFYGPRQAGIATPAPARLAFAAYDFTVTGTVAQNRAALKDLLQHWTQAAAAMAVGQPVPGDSTDGDQPPADTGEAYGSPPANLTITFGFGPSMFDDRFGLAAKRPAALADLPKLAPENLDPGRSGGDICIQACSDDPVVAFHAIRNLARIGRGTVVMRWSQLGFGKATSNGADQETPRNLLGFKDGTRNIDASVDTAAMNTYVWVGSETDQPWMRDGTYMVARRIRMHIEGWDRDVLSDQENVFGREKYTGAPLTGTKEFDTPDFTKKDAAGNPIIPVDAHIALAAHENNNGLRILRRGYSYTDGMLDSGELDAGLFFLAFQKDPRTQFVALQRKLGAHDALNEYIEHVGSALFACPPGLRQAGDYWGSALLDT